MPGLIDCNKTMILKSSTSNARIAQKGEPLIIRSNTTRGNFFDAVKTFDANIDNITNFVLL